MRAPGKEEGARGVWEKPAGEMGGVGEERARLLEKLGIRTIGDLLLHRPRRYEDRTRMSAIQDLEAGAQTMVSGTVLELGVKWMRRRSKSVFQMVVSDGTGRLHCQWWNMPFLAKQFAKGDEVLVFGKVRSLKPAVMDHPETERGERGDEPGLHAGRWVPIHPLTEGIGARWLRGLIWRALAVAEGEIADSWDGRLGRPTRGEALRAIHFPESPEEAEGARRRLALDEFIELQLGMQARRRSLETKADPLPCPGGNRLIRPFLAALPFALTEGQTGALREIRADITRGAPPMRRLLQGDVGSGKTVVAACAALMALDSGWNALLMAPTEILALQHVETFSRWFGPLGIRVAVHTGKMKSGPAPGPAATIAIGTHALIQEGFRLERVGMVIIDEQHKFGVAQRDELLRKGKFPHLLVMTATPIPRTLGLTLYGDLDISSIRHLPQGRRAIRSFVRTSAQRPKVLEFIKTKIAEGRQAYVVYPRVEDEKGGSMKAATRDFEQLAAALAPHPAALLHGGMDAEEKERVMGAFRRNEIKLLAATSVIEVGVDVPNAVVMVIENAEAFGMAQLHQLRGRVGRGAEESFCILLAGRDSPEALNRLKRVAETADGFALAEADLAERGPGEMLGEEQSGLPNFRFGDLVRDLALLEEAREWCKAEGKGGGQGRKG